MRENEIAEAVFACAIELHREVGPGLLESVYEAALSWQLTQRGFDVERQVPVPIVLHGHHLEQGFRADLLVEGLVIVEIKAIAALHPAHRRQVLTYLRLSGRWLGLLVNFGGDRLVDGFQRVVNGEPPARP